MHSLVLPRQSQCLSEFGPALLCASAMCLNQVRCAMCQRPPVQVQVRRPKAVSTGTLVWPNYFDRAITLSLSYVQGRRGSRRAARASRLVECQLRDD